MFTGVRVMLAERDRPSGIGYPCSSAASVTCWFQRCVRGMRRNSPSPRPAAFPPPSPPPMSLGIIRRFTGAMQPSDSSPVCMPIVRLLPSWAGPTCRRTQMRSPSSNKGRLHVHGVFDCARLLVRKPVARGGCCSPANCTASAPRNSTRFAAQYPARGIPCERFELALAGSPRITRGRRGWLGPTP